jgi:hypothetical protein
MMQKLRLDLDALQVQSFATLHTGAFSFGTVHAGQKEPTGVQDPQCSAVLPCESKLGCSEANTCGPSQNPGCNSHAIPCPSSTVCALQDPSADCSSRHTTLSEGWPTCRLTHDCPACTETSDCPAPACPGPYSLVSCQDTGGS